MNISTRIHARWLGSLTTAVLAAATTASLGCVASGAPDDTDADESADEGEAALTGVNVGALVDRLNARGVEATKGHPVEILSVPANTDCGSITVDASNALVSAVVYAERTGGDRAKYARAAATILDDWARVNKGFRDPNGFLCAAWNVGAMARAAYILKSLHAPEYEAIKPRFEAWITHVAEANWLPIDESRPPANSRPELLQGWELSHISNRTMVCLEATLHVARLVGNATWRQHIVDKYKQLIRYQDFHAPAREGGSGTRYYVDGSGKNLDDFRGDLWHQTAGLASSVQICEVVKSDTGEDLFPLNGEILRKSLERYGSTTLARNEGVIPFWDTAARAFPGSTVIRQLGAKVRDTSPGEYSWGFSRYLDRVTGGVGELSGRVSLRAAVDNQFVSAADAGRSPLIANRDAARAWEQFDVLQNADGTVSFRSVANGRLVSAEDAGRSALRADRDAVGDWEKFTPTKNGDGTFSFKAKVNGKFVCAEDAGQGALVASRATAGLWEKFRVVKAQ